MNTVDNKEDECQKILLLLSSPLYLFLFSLSSFYMVVVVGGLVIHPPSDELLCISLPHSHLLKLICKYFNFL